ncbi:MAG: M15 family metallopeptidase [Ruminococcus callidus]
MSDAAAQEGLDIYIGSDYRDYAYQVKIYNNYCNLYGWEQADSFSAVGYSEHQTGLTIDCNTIDDAFGDTQESVWLAQHCADYGFIIRFPRKGEHHRLSV